MVTRQNSIIYPKSDRINFDGGLANKFDRSKIQDNESPDCANVVFTNGAVETRGGTTKISSTTVGSFPCDGLYTRHDNSPAQTMVAWFNGTLYDYQSTTFVTVPSGQSVYTAGERVDAAEYENYMFFGNGYSIPYKYGGASDTFTRHGVYPPTATMTAATASTGSALTGAYQYAYTNVNSNLVESDLSPLVGTFTASSENVALSGIATAAASFGIESRRLYRTVTSGATFLRLATLSDNTTTSYEDAIADSSLGVEAPDDNGVPPLYSSVIYHQARMFMINPTTNLIEYSEIGNPYTVKSTSFLRVGDNTFDVPYAMEIYDNSLVIMCQQNPWIIYMPSTDPTDWRVLRVRANYGCRSPGAPFKFNNKVMFPAMQNDKIVGFAAISGQTVSPSASLLTSSAMGSDLTSNNIEPDIFQIQESQLGKIESMVFKNKAYIAVTYGDGNTTNNRIYVFDFSLGRIKEQPFTWTPWTGLSASAFTILDGVLYYGNAGEVGFVHQMNTATYNDDDVAIDSYYWTKEYAGLPGQENTFKDYRYIQLFFERSGAYFMNISKRVDSDKGSGDTQTLDLDPGGNVWGVMRWGVDDWGGGSDEGEERLEIAPSRGKRIQFKFDNQNVADQKFKVLGLNFVYNNKGLR
jgi:hypothetical protein